MKTLASPSLAMTLALAAGISSGCAKETEPAPRDTPAAAKAVSAAARTTSARFVDTLPPGALDLFDTGPEPTEKKCDTQGNKGCICDTPKDCFELAVNCCNGDGLCVGKACSCHHNGNCDAKGEVIDH